MQDEASHRVMMQFLNQPGIGTSCMDDLTDISMFVQCKESQQTNFTNDYVVSNYIFIYSHFFHKQFLLTPQKTNRVQVSRWTFVIAQIFIGPVQPIKMSPRQRLEDG